MNTHVKVNPGVTADLSRRSFLVGTAATGLARPPRATSFSATPIAAR